MSSTTAYPLRLPRSLKDAVKRLSSEEGEHQPICGHSGGREGVRS
jgi:hypothetical protein